jgi:hypothetical protein
MKRVTYILLLCFTIFSFNTLHAQQDYKIPVQNTKEGKLTLNDFQNDLPVEGYSGSDIIITSNINIKAPDRAKGLQPVYSGGTDNTGMAVAVEKNGSSVTLQCLLPITKSGNYKIKVPDNFRIEINNDCGHSGNVTVENIKGEVAVKNCQGIKVNNVSGPLVLSTISGNININFASLAKDRTISLASISGEIDVTVPSTTGVDVELQTISGSIYSDFDFSSGDKKMKRIGGNSISTSLNGGGADLKITNISGSIYFRKGKPA